MRNCRQWGRRRRRDQRWFKQTALMWNSLSWRKWFHVAGCGMLSHPYRERFIAVCLGGSSGFGCSGERCTVSGLPGGRRPYSRAFVKEGGHARDKSTRLFRPSFLTVVILSVRIWMSSRMLGALFSHDSSDSGIDSDRLSAIFGFGFGGVDSRCRQRERENKIVELHFEEREIEYGNDKFGLCLICGMNLLVI